MGASFLVILLVSFFHDLYLKEASFMITYWKRSLSRKLFFWKTQIIRERGFYSSYGGGESDNGKQKWGKFDQNKYTNSKNRIRPGGICMFKVNNRNTRARCEICSKLTIKTPERRQWRRSSVFTVNFEHISHLVLVFLLLTWSICRLGEIYRSTKNTVFSFIVI